MIYAAENFAHHPTHLYCDIAIMGVPVIKMSNKSLERKYILLDYQASLVEKMPAAT